MIDEDNLKTGDRVMCKKPCIMKLDGSVRTTVGKVYKIIRRQGGRPCIMDDFNHVHYFDDGWNEFFINDREEKLKRILKDV